MADTPIQQPGTPLRLVGVDLPLQNRVAPDDTQLNMRGGGNARASSRATEGSQSRRMPEQVQVRDTRSYTVPSQQTQQPRSTQPQQSDGVNPNPRELQRADAYDRVQRLAISHREKLAAGDTAGLSGLREDVVDVLSQYRYLTGDDVRELQQLMYNDYREDQDYRVGTTRQEARQTRDAVIETRIRQQEVQIAGIQEAVRMAPTPQKQSEALARLDALAQGIQNDESLDARTKSALLSSLYNGAGTLTREGQERFNNVNNMAQAQEQIAELQEQWRTGSITAAQLNSRTYQLSQQYGFTPPQLGEAATDALFNTQQAIRVLEVANNRSAESNRTESLQLDRLRTQLGQANTTAEYATVLENRRTRTAEELESGISQFQSMTAAQRQMFIDSPTGRTNFGKAVVAGHTAREEYTREGESVNKEVLEIDLRIQEIQQEDLNSQLRTPESRDSITQLLAASNPQLASLFASQGEEGLTPAQRAEVMTAARVSRQRQITLLEGRRNAVMSSYAARGRGIVPTQTNIQPSAYLSPYGTMNMQQPQQQQLGVTQQPTEPDYASAARQAVSPLAGIGAARPVYADTRSNANNQMTDVSGGFITPQMANQLVRPLR